MDIHEAMWEQQGGDGVSLDLRIICKPQSGQVTLKSQKDSQYEQTFESPEEATEAFNALLQKGTQSR